MRLKPSFHWVKIGEKNGSILNGNPQTSPPFAHEELQEIVNQESEDIG
jgi:hypothetical protein